MTIIGLIAGILTTLCWVPQVVRSWRTKSTRDFSWTYLIVLSTGVALWIVYGITRSDIAVLLTNTATLCLLLFLISIKLNEDSRARARSG
jgi:MtN3 and saliva related transmembrane protein